MTMILNKEPDADARHPVRRPNGHRSGRGCAAAQPGTLVVEHRMDAHVVVRTTVMLQRGAP